MNELTLNNLANNEKILIHGVSGSGKTALINQMLKEYKGDSKVIYFGKQLPEDPIVYGKLLLYSKDCSKKSLSERVVDMNDALKIELDKKEYDTIIIIDEGIFLNFVPDLTNYRTVISVQSFIYNNEFSNELIENIKKETDSRNSEITKVYFGSYNNAEYTNFINSLITQTNKKVGDLVPLEYVFSRDNKNWYIDNISFNKD